MRLFTQLTKLLNTKILNKTPNQFSHICSYSASANYDLNLTVKGIPLHNYIKHLEKEYELASRGTSVDLRSKVSELKPLVNILHERKQTVENIKNVLELLNEKDEEIRQLAEEEKRSFEARIKSLDERLLQIILPTDVEDECDSIVLEVNTGVGGQEAMLFANELFEMYCKFAEYKGWETQLAEFVTTDLGGIRHGSVLVNGSQVFRYFKHEAGVHRVQRIPATEKAGRIHTSTVSVVALPQPTNIQINIENKDLRIETKRASGAGGQHVNTTDSAVRITHIPSGLTVECQVDRSQNKNKQIAMTKLRALLYQKELEDQMTKKLETRKSQVRSNYRNEKVRTYNFPQDRITDHRLQSCNMHNLKGFFQGTDALEGLINRLDYHFRVETLLNIVNNLDNK